MFMGEKFWGLSPHFYLRVWSAAFALRRVSPTVLSARGLSSKIKEYGVFRERMSVLTNPNK